MRYENLKVLLNMVSRHGSEVLTDAVKETLQDQCRAPRLRRFHRSVSRSGLVVGVYTLCVKDYVEEGHFIHDRPELWSQIRPVFDQNEFGRSRRMQNSFLLIDSDGEDGSVTWVARVACAISP